MNESEPNWEQLRPLIDDALEALEPRERDAILVRFFENRPFREMGEAWCISEDAARMRVDRALEKLRGVLERRGFRSMPAALATILATQGGIAAPAGLVATVSGAALASVGAPSVVVTFFTIMTGTKTIFITGALILAFATSVAVINRNHAQTAELRLDAISRELASVRAQLARSERQKSAAETAAAEAERDSGVLLDAVAHANSPTATGRLLAQAGKKPPASNDPLNETLDALFPNGIVATIGDDSITIADVREFIGPLLAKVQQPPATPQQLRQRFYALQNSVIADLVTRRLNVKEFHNQADSPKHIASETVDRIIADRVKEQFNDDHRQLLASLDAKGVSLAQYRQSVEDEIIHSYMRQQQKRSIAPSQ